MRVIFLSLLTGVARAAELRGFEFNAPVLPSDPENLVVEQVWQFDNLNLAEAMTHIEWIPGTDQVVTGHKHGTLRLYSSIDSDVDDYTELIDMRPDVDSEGDHGLLSFHFHPMFEDGMQKAFVLYTGNPKNVELLPNNEVVALIREWGPDFVGMYEWPLDLCSQLGDLNENGKICEKVYYIDRLAFDLSGDLPTMVKELTLVNGACGSSSTHGPGTILEVNGDLLFSMGDGSQYDIFDAGFELNDGCYVPGGGMDQGNFRAQRDEFFNGKLIKIPAALLDSEVVLSLQDLVIVNKGLRQPYRMFYHEFNDRMYIADVGFGDYGTSERLFIVEEISQFLPGGVVHNAGWPCLEGIYDTWEDSFTENYSVYNAQSEQVRQEYLLENGLTTCDPVYTAVEAYVNGDVFPATADLGWYPPVFEYRNDILDADYPNYCAGINAAISSVFVYDGLSLPAEFQGKLIFSDHSKMCLFYFDNDDQGNPDFSTYPHILMSNIDVIDIQSGPDGYLYFIDYISYRVLRIYEYGVGPLVGDTPPPTTTPTGAPFAIPNNVIDANSCFNANEMPELQWTRTDDGSYVGNLVLGVVNLNTAQGTMRTRAYNGYIPGPLIRMKACGTYHLNLYNDLADWPSGSDGNGNLNGLKDPTVTNLHLHGLHISGEPTGDDVLTTFIEAGEMFEYTYIIPCDHSGGTNWYHPHHHGSGALQTDTGALGMLIIESNRREANDMPMDIQSMPEQFLTIQEFIPANSARFAFEMNDKIYESDIIDSFVLVNGCDAFEMTLEAGRWTRLHILNQAHVFNVVLAIEPVLPTSLPCDLGLMGKDGVWLSEVPRVLTDNNMFFSISSRLDVAIRCPVANVAHSITYIHLGDGSETSIVIGNIEIAGSLREPSEDMTVWNPCRPAYLTDIESLPVANFSTPFTLEVRDGLNTLVYTGSDDFIEQIEINTAQLMIISGTELHPFHMHVNHLQFGSDLTEANQWTEIINWNQPGDWIDSLSAPGAVPMFVHTDRYVGHMVLHCHIAEHSDNGIVGVINITGEGDEGDGSPEIIDFGTCPEVIPLSTAYMNLTASIPGKIEAEFFDEGGEGIAYHNINIDRLAGNAIRDDASVEIDTDGINYWVSYIRDGEWLKYSITVDTTAFYAMSIVSASENMVGGMQWVLWLDAFDGCPPPVTNVGKLLMVSDPLYEGSGSFLIFENYAAGYFVLEEGDHTLTLCFEGGDANMNFDGMEITLCGLTEEECVARRKLGLKEVHLYQISHDGDIKSNVF
eukprot:CAMPEP_0171462106 /NCGR_PEP_ID=MMETSP0945-20130129/6282_1 /TAXON_ID=109269 /ORGANISM="Vaucheria litorea, Strain CCMP2940" /LENGTH=1259 /DNA_ID=CAMNT_0011988577 /DNA_START=93 /DNA_END=3872 /DNA_ORIENTATION=+